MLEEVFAKTPRYPVFKGYNPLDMVNLYRGGQFTFNGFSDPIDDSGNFRLPAYSMCPHMGPEAAVLYPGICGPGNDVESVQVKVLPAIPTQEELNQKSTEQLKAERAAAASALLAVQAFVEIGDRTLIRRSPYAWLITQFGGQAVQTQLADIIAAYDAAIQAR